MFTASRAAAQRFGEHYSQGTGLGFAIVRGVVAAHDGRISVSSRLGSGTAIRIEFPPNLPEPSTQRTVPVETELLDSEIGAGRDNSCSKNPLPSILQS